MNQPTTPACESPAAIRYATTLLCVLIALSTLPWLWMSLGRFGGFAWGLFGYELIVLLGAVMTALVCLRVVRVGGALPLAIACLAGTILLSVIFGLYLDARNKTGGTHPRTLVWVYRTMFFDAGMIVLLAMLATLDVYRRNARSWGLMLRAAAFLLPVVATLAWVRFAGGPSVASADGEMNPMKMVLVMLVGLVLGILFSVGGHFLIRSYEVAVPDPLGGNTGKSAS